MGEEPNGSGSDVFVVVFEKLDERWECFFTMLFEGTEAKIAGVDGWAFKGSDSTFDGAEVKVG